MASNNFKCNHLTLLHFKVLKLVAWTKTLSLFDAAGTEACASEYEQHGSMLTCW